MRVSRVSAGEIQSQLPPYRDLCARTSGDKRVNSSPAEFVAAGGAALQCAGCDAHTLQWGSLSSARQIHRRYTGHPALLRERHSRILHPCHMIAPALCRAVAPCILPALLRSPHCCSDKRVCFRDNADGAARGRVCSCGLPCDISTSAFSCTCIVAFILGVIIFYVSK